MSNQEVANQLFLNTEAWEEISDVQGEAISGGFTIEEIIAAVPEDIANRIIKVVSKTSSTPNYDEEKTLVIIGRLLDKNGAINKFFS